MSTLEQTIEKGMLLRECIYGPAKTRKTWWALKAAELGFNTFLFDCDDGAHIGVQLPEAARKKVHVLNAIDELARPIAASFIIQILKGNEFLWDEDDKKQILYENQFNPEHGHYKIDAKKLTGNDIFILDSWTSLCYSIAWRYSVDNSIDLTDFDKPDWDGYAFCGRLANWILTQLKALPCHVIMIGHSTVYEKYSGSKQNRRLEWQRTQPMSVSGPHAMQIAKNFSDVIRVEMRGAMPAYSVQPMHDADGGSRFIEPGSYSWEELQIANIMQMARIPMPEDKLSEGFIYYPPGEEIDLAFLKAGGISGLIAQPATQQPTATNKLQSLLGKAQ